MTSKSHNIYLTSVDSLGDNTPIMLTLIEMLNAYSGKTALFRPIIDSNQPVDSLIEFICHRYPNNLPYEALYGCQSDQAHQLLANQQYAELLKIILAKYRALSEHCAQIVCVGSHYQNNDAIYQLEFNLDIANNLDCLLMPVIHGSHRDQLQLQNQLAGLKHILQENDCDVLAIIINGVDNLPVDSLNYPVYQIPANAF